MSEDQEQIKSFAAQLRQPSGEFATKIGELMNEGNLAMNLCTIENLKLSLNDKVLEIGMGNGFFVPKLFEQEESIQYIGCDFSEAMVAESSSFNTSLINAGKVSFVRANVANMPFEDQQFNKIFTVNTLYFWEDVPAVFEELKRVLKPDGILNLTIRPKSIMDQLPISSYGFTTYSKEDITKTIEKNGFKVVEVIEREDASIEFGGVVFPNAYVVVKAIKK